MKVFDCANVLRITEDIENGIKAFLFRLKFRSVNDCAYSGCKVCTN